MEKKFRIFGLLINKNMHPREVNPKRTIFPNISYVHQQTVLFTLFISNTH